MKKIIKPILIAISIGALIILMMAPLIFHKNLLNDAQGKQAIADIQEVVTMLYKNNLEEISLYASPELKTKDIQNTIQLIQAYFSFPPTDVKLINLSYFYQYRTGNPDKKTIVNASVQYQFDNKYYLVSMAYLTKDKLTQILNFKVTPLPMSLEILNKVDFFNASLTQYLIIAITILDPMIILIALIKCIRTKELKRKWIWIVFILLGFTTFVSDDISKIPYFSLLFLARLHRDFELFLGQL